MLQSPGALLRCADSIKCGSALLLSTAIRKALQIYIESDRLPKYGELQYSSRSKTCREMQGTATWSHSLNADNPKITLSST